jgi:hypothetical protein
VKKGNIVVPEEMLKAAEDAVNAIYTPTGITSIAVEVALGWLAENPIVPTVEQASECCKRHFSDDGLEFFRLGLIEWQRRMFLAPEPEVPEEIQDLCDQMDSYLNHTKGPSYARDLLVEGYRRGKESR